MYIFSQIKMPTCAIWGCNNGSGREKPREDGRICLLFLYKQTEAKKEWVERINRENFKPTENTRICEDHFTEDAYIPGSVTLVVDLKGTELIYRHSSISAVSISAVFDLTRFIILSYFPPL